MEECMDRGIQAEAAGHIGLYRRGAQGGSRTTRTCLPLGSVCSLALNRPTRDRRCPEQVATALVLFAQVVYPFQEATNPPTIVANSSAIKA